MAVETDSVQHQQPRDHPATQRPQTSSLLLHHLQRQAHRLAEADDPRNVVRPGAPVALVRSTVQEPHQWRPLADVERSDPLGSIALVGGHREQVNAERLDVDGYDPQALRRVAVEDHPGLAGDPSDVGDRLQRADLVVAVHHRGQDGVGADGPPHRVGVDPTRAVDREERQLETPRFEEARGLKYGVVLHRTDDEVPAAPLVRVRGADEGEVVRLGGAAGEDDLLRVARADRPGNALPRLVHRLPGALPESVHATGIAEPFPVERLHGLQHPRVHRGRGGVVQVHGSHRHRVTTKRIAAFIKSPFESVAGYSSMRERPHLGTRTLVRICYSPPTRSTRCLMIRAVAPQIS